MMKLIMSSQMFMLMMMILLIIFINLIPSQNKMLHPLIMSLLLLLLCLISSMNIELFFHINWISYLMFLIIIGGLMIIFLYFTSFINNMKMSFKWNYIIMMPLKLLLFFIFVVLFLKNFLKFFPWYGMNFELYNLMGQINNNKIMTMFIYNYNKNFSLIFCMIYLLMILTFIVKICINKKFSLRKLN